MKECVYVLDKALVLRDTRCVTQVVDELFSRPISIPLRILLWGLNGSAHVHMPQINSSFRIIVGAIVFTLLLVQVFICAYFITKRIFCNSQSTQGIGVLLFTW